MPSASSFLFMLATPCLLLTLHLHLLFWSLLPFCFLQSYLLLSIPLISALSCNTHPRFFPSSSFIHLLLLLLLSSLCAFNITYLVFPSLLPSLFFFPSLHFLSSLLSPHFPFHTLCLWSRYCPLSPDQAILLRAAAVAAAVLATVLDRNRMTFFVTPSHCFLLSSVMEHQQHSSSSYLLFGVGDKPGVH